MSEDFGLFLSYFTRNRDITKEIAASGKREDIRALILASVPAVQRPDPGIWEDCNGYCPASRPWRNPGEPFPKPLRAAVLSAFLYDADDEPQTCPPFPENDS